MNTLHLKKTNFLLLFAMLAFSFSSYAQIGGWNVDLEKDCNEALSEMIKKVGKLQTFKDKAYGYAIYPKITKAGLVIGGAGGKGLVYKGGEIVASSKLGQASFGLQAGGQQYAEVIFFENQDAFERFKSGKLKFNAQASATAITEGASADFSYQGGVAVFTMVEGGLMVEASIGGQHFSYDAVQ
jgi:lipid-binding SYLF domain-containing protein